MESKKSIPRKAKGTLAMKKLADLIRKIGDKVMKNRFRTPDWAKEAAEAELRGILQEDAEDDESASTQSVKITKNGIRIVNITRKGRAITISGVRPYKPQGDNEKATFATRSF
jgi:hypothetical protein